MNRWHEHRRQRYFALLALTAAIAFGWPPFAAASPLFGTVGLTLEDGRFVPGQMLRLYLVTEPVQIDYTDDPELNRIERIVRVNTAHIDFFKQYRSKASEKGYLLANTECSIAGTFTFHDIAPGRYFILVTFPSMIAGHKVAWQVPVDISADTPCWVHLTSDNLLLPALAR